jgi:hypothetical protein
VERAVASAPGYGESSSVEKQMVAEDWLVMVAEQWMLNEGKTMCCAQSVLTFRGPIRAGSATGDKVIGAVFGSECISHGGAWMVTVLPALSVSRILRMELDAMVDLIMLATG